MVIGKRAVFKRVLFDRVAVYRINAILIERKLFDTSVFFEKGIGKFFVLHDSGIIVNIEISVDCATKRGIGYDERVKRIGKITKVLKQNGVFDKDEDEE